MALTDIITRAFECNQCGNFRALLPAACPHCESVEPPFANVEYWKVDLERQLPTVEEAIAILDMNVRAGAAAGLKGLIVVHGYGSSGQGGQIRKAVRNGLETNFWADRVEEFFHCEDLGQGSAQFAYAVEHYQSLIRALRRGRFLGNHGVSALLLY